jgi:predicted dehydrogenase
LLAVGSRSQEGAEAFAQEYALSRAYGSHASLLQDKDIDIVYIATPHFRHHKDCLAVLAAGKAVMCEKPFALNAQQVGEVIVSARGKKLFCMEAMWMRFNPLIQEAKKYIEQGALGEVRSLRVDFGYPAFYDPQSRLFNLEYGGGALLDRGVYTLSLANYLLGRPEKIQSHAAIGPSDVDTQSAYLLSYADGAVAELSATLESAGTNEAVIAGTAGQLRIHDPFYRPSRLSLRKIAAPEAPSADQSNGLTGGLKGLLKRPGVQKLRRRMQPLSGLLEGGKKISSPFLGNGYQFEIAEATCCLQQGLTESNIMPLDDSLAVMQDMDGMRRTWGMIYPQERE